MELPLPEAAKNTPDRNPASLQQTRKLGPLKLRAGLWWKGSTGLLQGEGGAGEGASGSVRVELSRG